MKTYLKGIKTAAVIFLSLALFSCQEEQIEPVDTLSADSDQIMLKRGGKDGSRVNYSVSLSESDIVTFLNCNGSCNSKQDLLWFADECSAEALGLRLQSIRLEFGKSQAECRVIMYNDTNTFFGDWTEGNVDELMDGFMQIFGEVNLHKKLKGKNKGVDPDVFGTIRIGKISIDKI